MKKFLIALAVALATVIGVGTTELHAEWTSKYVGTDKRGDGSEYRVWAIYDNEGKIDGYFWELWKYEDIDDPVLTKTDSGSINPNPEGGGRTQKGDINSQLALALQKGGKLNMTPAFAKTPLGKLLIDKGIGIVPAYRPGPGSDPDGTGGGGQGGVLGMGIKELDLEKNMGGKLGGIDFLPNSGGVREFISKNKGKKGNTGGGDPDKKTGVAQGGVWGDLPGPPELVNPDPVTRSRAKGKQPSAAMQLPSAAAGGAAGRTSAPSGMGGFTTAPRR